MIQFIKSIDKMELSNMKYAEKKVRNLKIAYIGGGSRGWAW